LDLFIEYCAKDQRSKDKAGGRFKALTIVRKERARTWLSLMYKLNWVIREGLFGGCLKRCEGSGCFQYSSSHSMGLSRSKLRNQSQHKGFRARRKDLLFILNCTGATESEAQLPVQTNQKPKMHSLSDLICDVGRGLVPEGALPQLVLYGHHMVPCFTPMCAYFLCQPDTDANHGPT
jgi:hypothetical protein